MIGELVRDNFKVRGFKVIDPGEYYYDCDWPIMSISFNLYEPFYGDTLHCFAQGGNLIYKHRHDLDNKPSIYLLGSCSSYVLNPEQIQSTESVVIKHCHPQYNIIYDKGDELNKHYSSCDVDIVRLPVMLNGENANGCLCTLKLSEDIKW